MAGVVESECMTSAVSPSFPHKMSNTSCDIIKAEIKTEIKSRFHSSSDAFVDKIYDFYL